MKKLFFISCLIVFHIENLCGQAYKQYPAVEKAYEECLAKYESCKTETGFKDYNTSAPIFHAAFVSSNDATSLYRKKQKTYDHHLELDLLELKIKIIYFYTDLFKRYPHEKKYYYNIDPYLEKNPENLEMNLIKTFYLLLEGKTAEANELSEKIKSYQAKDVQFCKYVQQLIKTETMDEASYQRQFLEMAKVKGYPVLMSDSVNSKYDDVNPILSADGQFLFISRFDNGEYNGSEKSRIMYSKNVGNGNWSLMKPIGSPPNNRISSALLGVSADVNTLFLLYTYDENGTVIGNGTSVSHRTSNGWSIPRNMQVKDIDKMSKKKSSVAHVLSASGKVLISSIDKGDKNFADLHVSFLEKDSTWSKPKPVDKNINTTDHELNAFLAPDDRTLYFIRASSESNEVYKLTHKTSSKVFMSRRLDETWTKWSAPALVGEELNSQGDVLYFTLAASGKEAIVGRSIQENNYQNTNLYWVYLEDSVRPKPVTMVSGKVFDTKTKKPIRSLISYEDLANGTEAGIATSAPTTGAYSIALPRGKNYGFHAKAKGYLSLNDNMDLTELKEYQEAQRDLYLTPIEEGQSIRLNNVFFERSKDILLSISYPELDRLANILKENKTMHIQLQGHTDNQGDASKNLELSELRVKTIKAYLVAKGIESARIEGKGFGGSKPVASNATEETRKQNRRVEFIITKQ
jgi:outer membrane protein OmpA-like peptidoglycan-associated protein